MTSDSFWCSSVAALYARTQGRAAGLTSAEAAERLARFGPNRVSADGRSRLAWKIWRRFSEPLVVILLVAAVIAGATGDVPSLAIILAVVGLSIVLDVVQEHRAEVAAEALKRSVAIHADVRRDQKVISIPVEEVVPGDVIELRAGDLVPADGLVLQSRNAHVNEALMTGEPYPAEKRVGPCDAAVPADAFNALFAGTSLVSGEATMLAVATGGATRFGGIASALAGNEQPSTFERGIHRLGLLIMRLTVLLTLFVLLVHLAFGRAVIESFLFAAALAVGLTPELLPMVMTVTLSRGALRMARRKVIVKRLASIHDLGAMDVLCTDKTGTLTEAKITLLAHPGTDGHDSERVLLLAAINSRFESGVRSPLDDAIVAHDTVAHDTVAHDTVAHDTARSIEGWRKIDEVPFDFERRRISVLVENEGARILIIKGAPESVLPRATSLDLGDGRTMPLDAAALERIERMQAEQAAQGFRLLAVAWKAMPADRAKLEPDDERDLVIAGFCVFVDPPKASAAEAISRLAAAGVRVKVVSGDHDAVVRHLVETLRIPARGMLTGRDIDGLTDAALIGRVEAVDVFARVSPDQKTRIIRALQAHGHTVGFIGDGVNDAPAIRAAEVGVSVEGATDVARAAADIILLAPDLGVLAEGVTEGRRTFANILKYVRMGTSSNFGNMLSMALASLVLPFLPLLPIQILLNNLFYDTSEIGIPFDRVDGEDLDHPRSWDLGEVLRFTLVMGSLSSVFDLITFTVLLKVFHAEAETFRTAWFVESIVTQILVIFIIRTWGWAWRSWPDRVLATTSLLTLAAAVALALTPLGAGLGFVTLPASLLGAIAVIAGGYLASAEIVKVYGARRLLLRK
jgi:P-type Mg2+ transporter